MNSLCVGTLVGLFELLERITRAARRGDGTMLMVRGSQ